MNTQEIINFCLKKGLLIDEEVLNLFNEVNDMESVKMIIEKIKDQTQQKVITRRIFEKNKEYVKSFFQNLPEEEQRRFEKFSIKLGFNIEISREIQVTKETKEEGSGSVKIFSLPFFDEKPEVKSFVRYFRSRLSEMRKFLENRAELGNLVSINKVSSNRQEVSIIGLVSEKVTTKNKNILLEVEDVTGKIKVLVNRNKTELYKKAEEITPDSVIGFKGVGNREIIFANIVVFPESILQEKKSSLEEEYALFIGDLHCGSKLFLEKSFLKFIEYINGNVRDKSVAEKIKYLFIVGDVVSGVGNYPLQERDLEVDNLEKQFEKLASLLRRIRKDIKIIVSPGNHDGVRLMEPQPIFDKKYAWPLYEMENITLIGNPSNVNIGARNNFSGFDVLVYHGFSYPYYANSISHLILERAIDSPNKIMKYLLKNRHLAPTHSSSQHFPLKQDSMIIKNVPDIFVSGHLHKSDVSYYNNILLISTSSWERITPYEEKMGSNPDFCKVPIFNLKTRELKILDFE